jgi:hypothetical protein
VTPDETPIDASPQASPQHRGALDAGVLDSLAGSLVWRIGRASDDGPVTVRVGLAGAAAAFSELPKLRNATDAELREAIEANDVRVEWVGAKGR